MFRIVKPRTWFPGAAKVKTNGRSIAPYLFGLLLVQSFVVTAARCAPPDSLNRAEINLLFNLPPAAVEPALSASGMSLFPDRPSDEWWAYDKAQHVAFSFLITLAGQYTLESKGVLSRGRALPVSVSFSAATGVAKELYDWRRGPTRYFSRKDLVADFLGILAASGLILL